MYKHILCTYHIHVYIYIYIYIYIHILCRSTYTSPRRGRTVAQPVRRGGVPDEKGARGLLCSFCMGVIFISLF